MSKVTLPACSSVCTHLLGNEKRDSPETTVNEELFLHGNSTFHQSQELENLSTEGANKTQVAAVGCRVLQGLQKWGPAPVTDLGLGKGSEDRHQLLIFRMVSPAERDVEDMDWLLVDVLGTKPNPWVNRNQQQQQRHPSTT